jgi:hypothetical protein
VPGMPEAGGMKLLAISGGKFTKVDDADYALVTQFNWFEKKSRNHGSYARRNTWKDGRASSQYLHNLLFPEAEEVDHRDGDGLNNQRSNLRPSDRLKNSRSFRHKASGKTSPFRGVSWGGRKWRAFIHSGGKTHHLGVFTTPEAAARAYDAAARTFFGSDAAPNYPEA